MADITVLDKDLTSPPGGPTAFEDQYIVASVATGAWTGQEDDIAFWDGAAWQFTVPENGTVAHVDDEGVNYTWSGTAWEQLFQSGSGGTVAHASTHQHSGNDEIAVATAAANAIPKALGTGKLDSSWLPAGTGDVDGDKVIYVGKHGDDGNDGKTLDKAVLTFGQAITLVNAETPSSSNVWGIICLDGGIYAESFTVGGFTHLFAANAVIEGSITLDDDSSTEIECLKATSGTAITKSSGAGKAYIQVKKLETSGTADGIDNSSTGILNMEIEQYDQTGGVGLQGTSGITHADIQDWDLYGASPVAVKTTAGTLNLRNANLAERGGSGTSIAFDCNGGTTNALAVDVSTDTCYDVESGATLNLITARCAGTELNDGTVNATKAASYLENVVEDTTPQLGGTLDAQNNDVDNVKTLTFNGEHDNGSQGASWTLTWDNGNKQKVTLTASTTSLTINAPDGPSNLLLKIVQGGAGSFTITWPASVKWAGGTAPTLSTAASSVDIVSFYYDGTDYYGVANMDFS